MAEVGTTDKRLAEEQDLVPSKDESIMDKPDDSVEYSEFLDGAESASTSFKEMSDGEIAEHMNLCLKLSAEKKINTKNAFELHLIDILKKKVNETDEPDIQQASLSLEASSEIYSERVDSLYEDVMKFKDHLDRLSTNKNNEVQKTSKFEIYEDDRDSLEGSASE